MQAKRHHDQKAVHQCYNRLNEVQQQLAQQVGVLTIWTMILTTCNATNTITERFSLVFPWIACACPVLDMPRANWHTAKVLYACMHLYNIGCAAAPKLPGVDDA